MANNIDSLSMTMGWLVGRRIAGQRGKKIEHIHDYEVVVTDPTCTNKGYTAHYCACGDSYVTDVVDALGHDYVSEVIAPTPENEGYTLHTCSRCGDSYKDNYTDKIKPIAYLYNGIQLPPVPDDWDEETYPYLIMQNSTYLWMYDANVFVVNAAGGLISTGNVKVKRYSLRNGIWVHTDNFEWGAISITSATTIKWSSIDILRVDGTVYLAASDLVPVYE